MVTLNDIEHIKKLKLNIKLFGFVYVTSCLGAICSFLALLKTLLEVSISSGFQDTLGFIIANIPILILITSCSVISLSFYNLRLQSQVTLKRFTTKITREYVDEESA